MINVNQLDLTFKSDERSQENIQHILKNINFEISAGSTYVLLGESGSGKSLISLSIMQLLPKQAYVGKESHIKFLEKDLLTLSEMHMRALRGGDIAMIFQEPMTSLNPVLTIAEQMAESLKIHQGLKGKLLNAEIIRLLEAVHLKNPERVQNSYPHQLSGGMKQRIMIAMALAGKPKLLIADEPTTALDVTTQAQILKLLKELQQKHDMAMLFITHDIKVAKTVGTHIGVLHKGVLVEQGNLEAILHNPQHPYTRHLIHVKPMLNKKPLQSNAPTVLSVDKLKIYFPIKKGFWKKTVGWVPAVDEVSFSIQEGETLALVGESGCGKTTLAKAILGLIPPTAGDIAWLGQSLQKMNNKDLRLNRRNVQIIFQDPFGAMDPRFRVLDILLEGMRALNIGINHEDRLARVDKVLLQVGLEPQHKHRFPHQFSGGQRQRICIARALAVEPKLIVCDEPISSLDVSMGAQILDLLISLQQQTNVSYLFITHNLSIVPYVAHRIAVMHQGKIVEYGACEEVLHNPKHAYTKELLLSSGLEKERAVIAHQNGGPDKHLAY